MNSEYKPKDKKDDQKGRKENLSREKKRKNFSITMKFNKKVNSF